MIDKDGGNMMRLNDLVTVSQSQSVRLDQGGYERTAKGACENSHNITIATGPGERQGD